MTAWAMRAHANGLGDDRAGDVVDAVRRVVALQGQEPSATETRLLGHFDAFLLGYRERNVADQYAWVLQTGGGFVMPAVSAGGRLVAAWRLSTKAEIAVTTFTALTPSMREGIDREVADLGRFLGRPITLGEIEPASSF